MKRYVSRRQNDAVALTSFFHDQKFLQSNYFPEFSKATVKRCGKKVFEKLYNNELMDTEDEEINASIASEIAQTENEEASFLKEYMNAIINLTAQVDQSAKDSNNLDQLKSFEKTLTRSENVQKLYNCMFTMKANGLEAERVPSAAGLFIGKLKTISRKRRSILCVFCETISKSKPNISVAKLLPGLHYVISNVLLYNTKFDLLKFLYKVIFSNLTHIIKDRGIFLNLTEL